MLKQYFRNAWRNLLKSKAYTAINIIGLAVGLAGFIMILLYLNHELSYDTWDPSLKKIYKISLRTDEDILEQTPAPLGKFLKENYSDIEAATTISPSGDYEVLLSNGNKKIYQKGCIQVDSSFLKVFPYKLVIGDARRALDKPNAMVISQEVAKKLFGSTSPIGKIIKVFNAFECEVTGVMQQPDKPSHLNVQLVYRSPNEKQNNHRSNYSFHTYVRSRSVVPVQKLEHDII